MQRNTRKVRSFDVFEGHAYYTPAVGGMFALLGLLLVGALFGSLVTALLTLALGSGFALEYGNLIAYPLMFIPPMMYAGYKSRSNAVFEQGYALDNHHFSPHGGLVCALLSIAAVLAAAFMTDAISAQMPPMPEWLDEALTSLTQGKLWVNLLCVSVFAPLFEEWLCRGMVGDPHLRPVLRRHPRQPLAGDPGLHPGHPLRLYLLPYRLAETHDADALRQQHLRRHLRADRLAEGNGQLAGRAPRAAVLGAVRRLRAAADPCRACLRQGARPVSRRQLRPRL